MDIQQETSLAIHLRTLISRQKKWDETQPPKMEALSQYSQELSHYTPSPTTQDLQTFWVDDTPNPNKYRNVLEVLARSQGYTGWQEFLDTHQMPLYGEENLGLGNTSFSQAEIPWYRKYMWVLLVANLVILTVVVLLILFT